MKDSDIDVQRDQHIKTFHSELKRIYTRSNGFMKDFDEFHRNVQLALFDMIFNLGATTLVNVFQKFNRAVKIGDWRQAAIESHRVDVNAARNQYVRQLLNNVPTTQPAV